MKDTCDFEVLLETHLNDLYRLAFRLTRNKEVSEDLVQDVFISIDTDKIKPDNLRNPRAWLSTILYRRFVEYWRRQKRETGVVVPLADNGNSGQENHSSGYDGFQSHSPGPQQMVENELKQEKLMQALDLLTPEYREVLVFHDVEGFSLPELTVITGTPLGTLKSRLHRARSRMQDTLEEINFFDS